MADTSQGQTGVGSFEEAPFSDDFDDTDITPDPKPKWRSMIYIYLKRQHRPVLADSGCTGSCMSYQHFVKNPYLKRYFTPRSG